MLHPVRCIKFGEILLDENRRLMLLCTQCHTDFEQLHDFQQHMNSCRMGGGVSGASTPSLFSDNASLVFPDMNEAQHLLRRFVKEGKEYQVYKYNALKRLEIQTLEPSCKAATSSADDDFMDLIKIEEELLDPRWYTEISSTQIDDANVAESTNQHQTASYNELVEAVTPFVQFKENLKTNESQTKIIKVTKETPPLPLLRVKKHILNGAKHVVASEKTSTEQHVGSKLDTYTWKPQRLPTVASTVMLPNGSTSLKLPMEFFINVPSNPDVNKICVSKQKLPIQKPQPQNPKQQFAKFLLPQTNVASVAPLQHTVAYKPPPVSLVNAPKIKTEKPKITKIINQSLEVGSNIQQTQITTTNRNLILSPAPPAKQETQQILNKLQTLGLQVKRKQPLLQQPPEIDHDPEKEKTLQLLKKLQSKGTNVKIIQPSRNGNCPQPYSQKRQRLDNAGLVNGLTQQATMNKNLIIRKLN